MAHMLEEMDRFIIIEEDAVPDLEEIKWTDNQSKLLIDLYGKYKPKVGSLNVKTMKQMWQIIAHELQQLVKKTVTAASSENRWKVLDRNFKKYIDNKNATGRGRKHFEFAEEMKNLLGEKKNVCPAIILSSTNVDIPEGLLNDVKDGEKENRESIQTVKPKITKNSAMTRKKNILEAIRSDRKKYQEDRLAIGRKKLAALEERNRILEDRNKILAHWNWNFNKNLDMLE